MSLACPLPIVQKLVDMQLAPLIHEGESSARQGTAKDLSGADVDHAFVAAVLGVEMGRGVVLLVERYHDAEKSADDGHAYMLR